MKKETAEKLLELTQCGYAKIAEPFSQTRYYAWRDFNLFLPFVKDGISVLDVGCGTGRVYEFLKGKIGRYTGVDTNSQFIKALRDKYSHDTLHPQFVQGDVLQLDKVPELARLNFAEQKLGGFDCVISIAAFHHIPSQALRTQAINQMKTYLKPGGVLILLNWNFWRLTLKRKSFWKYNLMRLRMPEKEWEYMYGMTKKELGYKDLLTLWAWGKEQTLLYYYSFTACELVRLLRCARLSVIENRYILNDQPAHWWNGNNILSIATKK